MPDHEINLATLFDTDKDLSDVVAKAAKQEVTEAKGAAQKVIGKLRWSVVDATVREKASELLNTNVSDLLLAGWKEYGMLSELAKQSMSGETVLCPLEDYSFHSEVEPYLDIKVASFAYKLLFQVSADIDVKGLELKIENGKIVSVCSGSCEGSGEIKWHDKSLLKRDFKKVDLPGRISFGSGIPLVAGTRDVA
jgi:hypothetical protein